MNEAGGDDARREAVEEMAIAWFIRMRGPHSKSEDAMLSEWLDEAPEHRRAYERAKLHFENSALLKQSRRYGRQRVKKPNFWLIGAAAAAAIVAVVAIGFTFRSRDGTDQTAPFAAVAPILQTRPGQIQSSELEGGIQIIMDADSRVSVTVNDRERRLTLERGRARITVQRDERPFRLEAGDGELLAQTGSFDVSQIGDGDIEIAVLSGEC